MPQPQPVEPVTVEHDEFADYGLLVSNQADAIAGHRVDIEPHLLVYEINNQFLYELETQKEDLKDSSKEEKEIVVSSIVETVVRKHIANLLNKPVSGLVAYSIYDECKKHIKKHLPFFERQLDSRVLQVLTLGRTPVGSESP